MEKDFDSWFRRQHPHQQSSNQNFLGSLVEMGSLDTVPTCSNPYIIENFTSGTFPMFPFSGLQQLKACELNRPCNWFYCLPRFRQAYAPVLNSGPQENLGQKGSLDMCAASIPKKFLVFDQSGDKTTLIYSSGDKTPVPPATCWRPKPPVTCDLIKEWPRYTSPSLGPISNNEFIESNYEGHSASEMHEDTEELNALLCSDSDSYCSDDDEVISTGHSPSTMIYNGIQELVDERSDEVANSAETTKRQKMLDGGNDAPLRMHSLRSLEAHTLSELDDDAESSCANGKNHGSEKLFSLSGRKMSRKESILETVSILQSIIPGGKGKDAIVVIDDAIDYLRSLKVKAKALGLDAL